MKHHTNTNITLPSQEEKQIDEPTTFLVDTFATAMKLNLPHSTIGGTSTLLWRKKRRTRLCCLHLV